MRRLVKQLGWLKSGLFWRTFVLLGVLIATSMMAWVVSLRTVERAPHAEQLAEQIISIVTVTRAALTHSAPDLRRELLFDLASNEGIRIYPFEADDVVEPVIDNDLLPAIETHVKSRLGQGTRFAGKVNDVAGFWLSFQIEDDAYWLRLDRERIERVSSVQWLGWGTATLLLSLLGAVFISRLINQPLSQLTTATRAVARGLRPSPLPERGPTEIREANRSFNQMVADLNRVESDRTVILAGISHDLRTPLARMQLEVEMANLSESAREGIKADLEQMDAIIGQFLEYAKPTDATTFLPINLAELLAECATMAARIPDVRVRTAFEKDIGVFGNPTDLKRVINNLIENARRYGKTPSKDVVELELNCRLNGHKAIIEVADHGPGVPQEEMDRLLRPFTRLDAARGQANGAGLGLAIVNRAIRRHEGRLRLSNRATGGLSIEIALPGIRTSGLSQTSPLKAVT